MYTVIIEDDVYRYWSCYQESWEGTIFNEWVVKNNPEVLSVEWFDGFNTTREFVFESEEMYHWFLLRQ